MVDTVSTWQVPDSASALLEEARVKPEWLDETVHSLVQLEEENIPPLDWIVDGLLTEGLTLFAGVQKVGKSIFLVNLGLSVAMGTPVLGLTGAKQGRVLYITPDDKQKRRFKTRLSRMIGDKPFPELFEYALTWQELDRGGIERLREYIEYKPDVKVIIIDVLKNVLPGIKENADAYGEVYQKLSPLKDLAQEYHVSIVIVTHLNKGNGDKASSNPIERVYGSMAYTAIADNVLMLDENQTTHQRSLYTAGKDLEQERFPLDYEHLSLTYTYSNERKEELVKREQEEAKGVVADMGRLLSKYPDGLTRSELIDILKLDANRLDQRIKRAKEAKVLCKDEVKMRYYKCGNPIADPTDPDYDPD